MIDFARSTTSSRSSVQAPVDRYFQPPSAETTTIDASTPGSSDDAHLIAPATAPPRHCRARRYAGEDADVRQPPGPLDGLPGPDHGLAVQEPGAPEFFENGRDVAVVEVAQPVDLLARGRLDGPDLHG